MSTGTHLSTSSADLSPSSVLLFQQFTSPPSTWTKTCESHCPLKEKVRTISSLYSPPTTLRHPCHFSTAPLLPFLTPETFIYILICFFFLVGLPYVLAFFVNSTWGKKNPPYISGASFLISFGTDSQNFNYAECLVYWLL